MWTLASALLLGVKHPVRNSLHPAGELSRPCWHKTVTLMCCVCAPCVPCCAASLRLLCALLCLLCAALCPPPCAFCVPCCALLCSAVARWRQLSEPADQVVWVDLLTKVRGAHTHSEQQQ